MEISTKVYYSELPSRNVYVDSVVNDLPGYYPARSEFCIEYDNDAEQDLTDICDLYDELVNNRGELDDLEGREDSAYKEETETDRVGVGGESDPGELQERVTKGKKYPERRPPKDEGSGDNDPSNEQVRQRKGQNCQHKGSNRQSKRQVHESNFQISLSSVNIKEEEDSKRYDHERNVEIPHREKIKEEKSSDEMSCADVETRNVGRSRAVRKRKTNEKYAAFVSGGKRRKKNAGKLLASKGEELSEDIRMEDDSIRGKSRRGPEVATGHSEVHEACRRVTEVSRVVQASSEIREVCSRVPGGSSKADASMEAFTDLCVACIDIYNGRLRDRNERKDFVRRHGFLDKKKIYSWFNIHSLELGDGTAATLRKFVRLFATAEEFDRFMQRMKLERELSLKLTALCELRRAGVRHLRMIPLYNKMKAARNSVHAEIRGADISGLVEQAEMENSLHNLVVDKKFSRPLEIGHLEKFKLLTEDEKELCSEQRLTPVSYLTFKEILIGECKKMGGLRLAQARPMLKIDVNKTRKVYNYLLEKKLIWQT